MLLCALILPAETYTIEFKSGSGAGDSSTKIYELSKIVLSATDNCVQSVITANNIYNAGSGKGIKGGTGSAKGELSFALNATYQISSMTVYAASFSNKNDTTASKGITVCGQNFTWEAGHRTEIRPYVLTLNQDIDTISISAQSASSNRWYVQKIEFEAPDPQPNTAVFEMPYMVDFGSVPVEIDEPSEDVVELTIRGKHVVGDIQLSLTKGTVFSLGSNILPAEGGEVDLAYSLTFASAALDTLLVSGRGADEQTITRFIPLKISGYSYTPPTFDVDSTCMAIGPKPDDYYERAQGTSDSVLKSKLSEIIFCGVRYRYGSGPRKSWDAFFHTDRDTTTNEVLDMYSNNVRYFDPEHPTASVGGFDIEHMLPKSWWGGTVNEAYCDLFHLVPGDASANRSKSNHAPGIPADSSFYNGSFVTGRDTLHHLTRVFCPADEYKGDFARAYFYIATCYGDSLTWVETGEAGEAMTNSGWQEFQPWLRDLLLAWHRMDPVSEKEKARAIEVNKIQGNRNPFIDYPDLAEYIWGDQQGQPVDFDTLVFSYDTTPTVGLIVPENEELPARKEVRNGQVVILRNGVIYTLLGQPIR